jgi:hypothetical protein
MINIEFYSNLLHFKNDINERLNLILIGLSKRIVELKIKIMNKINIF